MTRSTERHKRIGLHRSANHRYAWNDGDWKPGVTTIIGIMDKSGYLVPWAKRLTAQAAVHNFNQLGILISTTDEKTAVDMLMKVSDLERDRTAELGTRIHLYAENDAKGIPQPDLLPTDHKRALNFRKWVIEYQPRYEKIEYMVFSEKYGYGGTGDAILTLWCPTHEQECRWSIDYKTGKAAYATTALQLAGLDMADFIGYPDRTDKEELPVIDHFGVLHITDERAKLIEYSITPAESATFIAMLDGYNWKAHREKIIQFEPALAHRP